MPNLENLTNHNAISILGSTGSVGGQTLEVAGLLGLSVLALSAGSNVELLEEQVRRFKPKVVCLADEKAAHDFKIRIADMDVAVYSGEAGLIEVACVTGADTVVTAVSGMVGLLPTMAAIKQGRRIALANKETLVCAGKLVMEQAEQCGAEIIPVDSEHCAIFHCMKASSREAIKSIILTASGGPFRGKSREEMKAVTPQMALQHPTWNMGKKISIDSSTMMNKGLEVIEAAHLFDLPVDMIQVVVHPESIIHSMVEFVDNSVVAQLAIPDMRLPIQYALTYPEQIPSLISPLDLTSISKLTFEKPDMEAFPCLSLAYQAAQMGGTAGAILNGANEAAVDLFLQEKISYPQIYESIKTALETIPIIETPTLEDIIEAGKEANQLTMNNYSLLIIN
ncbi:MAG: 1-deoxy-D-xylulose-5-phosphate reductoisomerase [Oscillospiraceae bacterium]|nr:1-deoxy-D-xylulose-5-phosphate reductoisomerase [Oscillospiraceae bacterium]